MNHQRLRQMMSRWAVTSLLCALCLLAGVWARSPPVSLALQAGWDEAPLLTQLLYVWPLVVVVRWYLHLSRASRVQIRTGPERSQHAHSSLCRHSVAIESPSALSRLLDAYSAGRVSSPFEPGLSDRDTYERVLAGLQEHAGFNAASIESFKMSAAAREGGAAIQAAWQYFNASQSRPARASCGSFIELDGQRACEATEMAGVFDDAAGSAALHAVVEALSPSKQSAFPFDIVLSPGPNDARSAFLYADPQSGNFLPLYAEARRWSRDSTRLVLRWALPHGLPSDSKKLALSGYGASLDVKKADYLVIDDRPVEERKDEAASQIVLDADDEEAVEMIALTAEQIRTIGYQAVQYIHSTSDPLAALTRIAQDFPRVAHDLAVSVGNVTEELFHELLRNGRSKAPPGATAFWMNGLQLSEREVDTFTLLRHMRNERHRISSLVDLGLLPRQAIEVLAIASAPTTSSSTGGSADSLGALFDASDRIEGGELIAWWNDIEKDRRYAGWSTRLMDVCSPADLEKCGLEIEQLLRPAYPGQLSQIRRNLFNVILVLDLSTPMSAAFMTEEILPLITASMPLRFGLVPLLPDDETQAAKATATAKVIWHLFEAYSKKDAMAFLTELGLRKSFSVDELKELYELTIHDPEAQPKEGTEELAFDAVLANEQHGQRLAAAKRYTKRLGLQADGSAGHGMLNGFYFHADSSFRMSLQSALSPQMQWLQTKIYYRELTDDLDVDTYFYDLPTTLSRRNVYIAPTTERPLRIVEDYAAILKGLESVARWVQAPDATNLTESIHLVGDFDSASARQLSTAALKGLAQSKTARVAFLHNAAEIAQATWSSTVSHLLDLVKSPTAAIEDIIQHFQAESAQKNQHSLAMSDEHRAAVSAGIRRMGLKPGELAIVVNGRIIGDLPPDALEEDDFEALLAYERKQRLEPVLKAFDSAGVDREGLSRGAYADLVAAASTLVAIANIPDPAHGMFETTSTQRSRDYRSIESNYSGIHTGDIDKAYFQIGVLLDPLSDTAQKWSGILQQLAKLDSVYIEVFLNPRSEAKELPIKRFYRHAFRSALSFDSEGAQVDPVLTFASLPESALLTMAVDVPPSWIAFPKKTRYDLDNIRLSDLSRSARTDGIRAVFELENLLIEGHARDMPSNQPPRGLQLQLADANGVSRTDSLCVWETVCIECASDVHRVMANFGYFQLKGNPGVWQLSIREGRSAEVFELDSIGSSGFSSPPLNVTGDTFAVTTFEGITLYPRFVRKPGQQYVDLLSDETGMQAGKGTSGGLFGRLQNVFAAPKAALAPKSSGAEINIFTVASGLLYERMAMIMIVSVLRHTKSTCKFWFIQNFLSPSFKAFMPHLAEAYGFEYEFITFKWPHWLRTQKEKQRFIWGYKILFLDVLFPLELKRVIFVDSDQIVRTDLKQLIDLDLQGAPYGYTPMGDDRAETEGYRFWKSGYWKEHLAGRPYHISALYVIDLDRFRAIGAGDRLRAQYQALSADPNSLANLDQDLPNNMQAMLPIYSLDRSWLWCETWCSDEALKDAKTIDLCNNPMTHEPKLNRAKRLIPEWTVYDNEIAALAKRIAEDRSTDETSQTFAENTDQLGQAKEQVKEFVQEGTGASAGAAAEKAATAKEGGAGHVEGEL